MHVLAQELRQLSMQQGPSFRNPDDAAPDKTEIVRLTCPNLCSTYTSECANPESDKIRSPIKYIMSDGRS